MRNMTITAVRVLDVVSLGIIATWFERHRLTTIR